MALALIETSGAGDLRGVWVAVSRGSRPALAFLDPFDDLTARRFLDDAEPVVNRGEETWDGFLFHLLERQNLITVQRIQTRTELSARALLSEVEQLWPIWQPHR